MTNNFKEEVKKICYVTLSLENPVFPIFLSTNNMPQLKTNRMTKNK